MTTVTIPRKGTIPVMAVACGVMVGNIYLCQPILSDIATSFGVSDGKAALVSVATQLGYALGILFLVPLADLVDPKRLVRVLMGVEAIALACAAAAPHISILVTVSVALAFFTVVPQILMPLAPSLAPPEQRGRVIGALSAGLILGILLSRTIAGISADLAGSWRFSYIVAAIITALLFFGVPRYLDGLGSKNKRLSYLDLLRSLPPLLRYRDLLLSMGMNALAFGAFSAFWATLAFHLSNAPFNFGPAATGLFGLWGAPGAIMAPFAGRLSDRWGPSAVNGLAFAVVICALALATTLGMHSIWAIVVAVNLLDFGIQSGQVANQTRIFGIAPEIRGRLNTLYMFATFSGGAIGGLVGAQAWQVAGWASAVGVSIAMVVAAGGLLAVATLRARN